MGKKKLQNKSCKNCIRGIPVGINDEILCREKGVVTSSFSCSKFMPFEPDTLHRQLDYRCSDCIYFIFTPDFHNSKYGVCTLFSVRECDGSQKKACSKFTKSTTRPA